MNYSQVPGIWINLTCITPYLGLFCFFPQQINSGKVPEFVDSPKLANIFIEYERLGEIIGVGYVNDLNNIIREDDGKELIRMSEDDS